MFLCCGGNEEEKEAKRLNELIERRIKLDQKTQDREYKLLLLGSGEAGKSTFVKQMRIIHGKGYPDNEKKTYIEVIRNNIIIAARTLATAIIYSNKSRGCDDSDESVASDESDEENNFADHPLSEHMAGLQLMSAMRDNDVNKICDLLPHIENLHGNPEYQGYLVNGGSFNLPDSASYFLDPTNLSRIIASDYLPTEDDIIRSRSATTGILEFLFDIKKITFRIIDVGGQRSERKKWIHCFNTVKCIIFLTSMSEYDQTLVEASKVNRTKESVGLFSTILGYPIFMNVAIILFLNKVDLLEKKIKVSNIANYLPEYKGPPNDLEAAKVFFNDLYCGCNTLPKRNIYSHFTCATDTKNIQFVFDSVKDTLLQDHLRDFNLV